MNFLLIKFITFFRFFTIQLIYTSIKFCIYLLSIKCVILLSKNFVERKQIIVMYIIQACLLIITKKKNRTQLGYTDFICFVVDLKHFFIYICKLFYILYCIYWHSLFVIIFALQTILVILQHNVFFIFGNDLRFLQFGFLVKLFSIIVKIKLCFK